MRRWEDIPPVEMAAWEGDPVHYDMLKLSPDATVLVVTHSGPIYMIVAVPLQAPLAVPCDSC